MNRFHTIIAGLWLATLPLVAQTTTMDLEQTVSDQAQATTIAFDGLAFVTGSLGADSFLPPGKVADFSGFQYLRDNDPTQMGHNTDFVTIIARNVLNLLSPTQVAQLVERAKNQVSLINQYGYRRFPLMDAFRRLLAGTLPEGTTGLDLAAVRQYSGELYQLDGWISVDRAMLFGDILRNLTSTQLATLNGLAALGGAGNWPQNLPDPLQGLHLAPDISVGVMTYASEMYSWYAGSVAADTYFCPERQGTYFGSFYLKDAPAMGNPDYSIGTNVTADTGNAFLAALTAFQRQAVTNLVNVQRPYLAELVTVRSNIAVHLRQLMTTNLINTNAVLDLCYRYGELDGAIVHAYATHFARVGWSLSTNQEAALMALRLQLLGKDLLYPAGAYLYSAPIAMPAITNTDFLFGAASADALALADTGQTRSYTSTPGEDADYTANPPSFTDMGDGTVMDNVTGLVWQKGDSGELTWESAVIFAQTNRVGGRSDWRLPTSHELFGILNHGTSNPALDAQYFTVTTAEYWWSSEVQATDPSRVWVANAGGGLGPHPKTETISAGGAKRFHARCVRGPLLSGRAAHHFTNNQDGTVTDMDTGLTWQQAEVTNALSWADALLYARSLTLAGQADWRVPNVKELQSLSDQAMSGPSVNTNYFPATQPLRYWSSTTEVNDPNRAWWVDFQLGIVSYDEKTTNLLVRCVRGGVSNLTSSSVVAPGATLAQLASGLHFAEGPAADALGNVFFSDIPSATIYEWSLAGQLSVFRTNSGGANGLAFDARGNLLACEGANGRLVSITPQGNLTALASAYGGQRFNEPNDLWIDPGGGVYFTDPVFLGHDLVQGGEHVYYLAPDRSTVRRVVADFVRPNGLAGTPDGKTLYLADWGATNVFRYQINPDGTLTNKALFASVRCDGMTLDAEGNVYLCGDAVLIYDATGKQFEAISVPERPTNVEFGGSDRQTLFITTDGGSLYALRMRVQGVGRLAVNNPPPIITDTALFPAVPTTNDTVWVTARVTDNEGVTNVTLTYNTGASMGFRRVFLETMGTNSLKPWAGEGCDHAWTVTFAGSNPFEQREGANYGAGNPNGLEFKGGTTNLADALLSPAAVVDARGSGGSVEFAVWSDGLSGDAGWTFQLDAGAGYVTRLSELTGTNHNWQVYRYDLQATELVAELKLRWQFRGGQDSHRIDLDQIVVRLAAEGTTRASVAMFDDGLHHDGAAGDGVYGAELPAFPAGSTVNYYLTATDKQGAMTTNPPGAPDGFLSYSALPLDLTPFLLSFRMTSAGTEFTWSSVPGRTYEVLYKAPLDAGSWSSVGIVSSTGTVTAFADTEATRLSQPQGFYRVALLP